MLVEVGYVEEGFDLDLDGDVLNTVYTYSGDTVQVNLAHVITSQEMEVTISREAVVENSDCSIFGKVKTIRRLIYVYDKTMKVMRTVMSNGDILYLTHDLGMLQQEEYRK